MRSLTERHATTWRKSERSSQPLLFIPATPVTSAKTSEMVRGREKPLNKSEFPKQFLLPEVTKFWHDLLHNNRYQEHLPTQQTVHWSLEKLECWQRVPLVLTAVPNPQSSRNPDQSPPFSPGLSEPSLSVLVFKQIRLPDKNPWWIPQLLESTPNAYCGSWLQHCLTSSLIPGPCLHGFLGHHISGFLTEQIKLGSCRTFAHTLLSCLCTLSTSQAGSFTPFPWSLSL